MIQTSLFEQFSTLYKIFINNKYILNVSIIGILAFIIFELFSRFHTKKIIKVFIIILYLGLFGALIYFYGDIIFNFLDYLMNNIFILLFFPNLAVYTLVIIIMNVLFLKSIFSDKDSKLMKTINIIFFIIINIVFYLILDNVMTNKIDIYENLSIYTNNNLLVLIQISMYLFIIWLAIIIISNISNHIIAKMQVQQTIDFVPILDNKLILKPNNNVKPIISESNNVKEIKNENLVYKQIIPSSEEIFKQNHDEIKISSVYNDYVNIEPVKKKSNVLLDDMDDLFNKDMDTVFGKNNQLNGIMNDIEKLRYNQNDKNQIRKIYENISLNSKNLTLNDYNYLINALTEIKNNN